MDSLFRTRPPNRSHKVRDDPQAVRREWVRDVGAHAVDIDERVSPG
jgi:hypothetical protein